MKKFSSVDKNNRQIFNLTEVQKIVYKSILSNQKESIEVRYKAHLFLLSFLRQSSVVKIKNKCILTNRSRSVYRKFKMSRLMFRKMALEGKLIGVKKASW